MKDGCVKFGRVWASARSCLRPDKAIEREQGHLRVVRHGAEAAPIGRKPGDAVGAEPGDDIGQTVELGGRTERVAAGAAEKGAADTALGCRRF